MRLLLHLPVWLLFCLLLLIACDDKPAPVDRSELVTTPLPTLDIRTLTVKDINGKSVVIHPGEKTVVFAVASWCPHTRSFIKTITHPRIKYLLKPYELVFVFEADEWPSVRDNLKHQATNGKYHGVSVDSYIKHLKKQAGNGPLFDPQFLDMLPGAYYFLTVNDSTGLSFPYVYSTSSGKFDTHAIKWAATQIPHIENLYFLYEEGKDPGQ